MMFPNISKEKCSSYGIFTHFESENTKIFCCNYDNVYISIEE
jgi:hypothetical protein